MTRLALVISGIDFEDNRLTTEEWAKLKPTAPYNQLPFLIVDNETHIAQSSAILRFCAKLGGLYPTDPLQAAKADEVVDAMADIGAAYHKYNGTDSEKLRESRESFVREYIPHFFSCLEKRFNEFGKGPCALGRNITIADCALYNVYIYFKYGLLEFVPKDVLDEERYPRVMQSIKRVEENKRVVAWYKEHPMK